MKEQMAGMVNSMGPWYLPAHISMLLILLIKNRTQLS